jgi:hypothetical protein
MLFNHTFKNIKRVREIIGVLMKYGLEDIIVNSTLRNFVSERKRLSWSRKKQTCFPIFTLGADKDGLRGTGPNLRKVGASNE